MHKFPSQQYSREEARPTEPECMNYRLVYRWFDVNVYRKSTDGVTTTI
jgi:hypothetical protein